jgi:hypothetical protein
MSSGRAVAALVKPLTLDQNTTRFYLPVAAARSTAANAR